MIKKPDRYMSLKLTFSKKVQIIKNLNMPRFCDYVYPVSYRLWNTTGLGVCVY